MKIKLRAWHEYGKSATPAITGMIYDENPGDCLFWKNQGQKIIDIMQYTGKKDKNGVEIYAGDIMTHPDLNPDAKMAVSFKDGCFYLGDWDCVRTDFSLGVVVGNVHENQELIEDRE